MTGSFRVLKGRARAHLRVARLAGLALVALIPALRVWAAIGAAREVCVDFGA